MKAQQEILTVRQAAELTPWSVSTLYKIAKRDPRSPFRKVWNQLVTTREDLIEWVRSSPSPVDPDPMPKPQTVDELLQYVESIR